MVPGFNHNIRHKGLLFHVQTEDRGPKTPVVETFLFFGGNVIASRKTSYEQILLESNAEQKVLSMMKDQHKEMLKDAVNGRIQAVEQIIISLSKPSEIPASQETSPLGAVPPPLGKRDAIPPPKIAPRPYRKPPPPPLRVLDADQATEKSLDELILDFLSDEPKK